MSARIFHPEPGAKGLRGKTLQYLEESIAHWVMSRDVLVFMIPTVGHQGMIHPSNIRLRDYAKHLDGLLLQGGADVSPQTYAASDARPEWPGDRVRDMYELELLHEFVESGKPVLGVCRGCQLINVAFGGSLYQDIATDVPTANAHVSEHYDQHRHAIRFPDSSTLASMFPGRSEAIVNSIHHQAIRDLGRDLNIEAVSAGDGIIEGIRHRRSPFVVGVQWHPEFHRAGGSSCSTARRCSMHSCARRAKPACSKPQASRRTKAGRIPTNSRCGRFVLNDNREFRFVCRSLTLAFRNFSLHDAPRGSSRWLPARKRARSGPPTRRRPPPVRVRRSRACAATRSPPRRRRMPPHKATSPS